MTERCDILSLKLCFTCLSFSMGLLIHFPPLCRALPRDGCSWLCYDQQRPPFAARSCKLSMCYLLYFFLWGGCPVLGWAGHQSRNLPLIFVVIIPRRTLLSSACMVDLLAPVISRWFYTSLMYEGWTFLPLRAWMDLPNGCSFLLLELFPKF